MLSEILKSNLESRKMSIYKLSKLTGIPNSTLRDLINGKSQTTTYDKLVSISKVLNIPIKELTGEEEIKLDGVYLEIAISAQNKKIDPDKLKALIKILSEDDKK